MSRPSCGSGDVTDPALHQLPAPPTASGAVDRLSRGVIRIGIEPGTPGRPGCSACRLDAGDGLQLRIAPRLERPADGFDVCALDIELDVPDSGGVEWRPAKLAGPLHVSLLETETWLDPRVFCRPTFGDVATLRCQGPVGSAAPGSAVVCRYIGGMELRGPGGETLFIATSPPPCALHVGGIADDGRVARSNFRQAV